MRKQAAQSIEHTGQQPLTRARCSSTRFLPPGIITPTLLAAALLVSTAAVDASADSLESTIEQTRSETASAPLRQPIVVEADSFVLLVEAEKAIWRGNVTASQGNYTFRSTQLTLHLDQIDSASSAPGHAQTNSSDPSFGYELSARTVSYNVETATIIGDGDSELRRGHELIKADQIQYNVDEKRAYAIPTKDGRVKVKFLSNPDKPVFPSSFAGVSATAGD